jgi:low affinity Fe/Cu permease
MRPTKSRSRFTRLTKWTAHFCGQPITFTLALGIIVGWALLGPYFGFSDTWQLVINTGTTIVTFLMVFLIQNTQNRDTEAMQLKLDELIRATRGAHLALLDLEKLTDDDVAAIRSDYEQLAHDARQDLERGRDDTGTPEVKHGERPRAAARGRARA